jgi:stage III sporulation protein SpoIIIAA
MIGLTLRVGRALPECADIIEDLTVTGESILLLGRPGTGKTSMLRAMAARLAEYGQRVMVVDTSNEIGGDGDTPHPTLGYARRLQVPFTRTQTDVMIEAVENHTPDVIIVDEISSYNEALAARTIARRGVKLVATAHGNTIEDVLRNPPLTGLLGGVKAATLSDAEAQKRGTQKTIQEQEAPATFNVVVEITSHTTCNIYRQLDNVVATILSGGVYLPEQRQIDEQGRVSTIRPQYLGDAQLADIEKQFLVSKE